MDISFHPPIHYLPNEHIILLPDNIADDLGLFYNEDTYNEGLYEHLTGFKRIVSTTECSNISTLMTDVAEGQKDYEQGRKTMMRKVHEITTDNEAFITTMQNLLVLDSTQINVEPEPEYSNKSLFSLQTMQFITAVQQPKYQCMSDFESKYKYLPAYDIKPFSYSLSSYLEQLNGWDWVLSLFIILCVVSTMFNILSPVVMCMMGLYDRHYLLKSCAAAYNAPNISSILYLAFIAIFYGTQSILGINHLQKQDNNIKYIRELFHSADKFLTVSISESEHWIRLLSELQRKDGSISDAFTAWEQKLLAQKTIWRKMWDECRTITENPWSRLKVYGGIQGGYEQATFYKWRTNYEYQNAIHYATDFLHYSDILHSLSLNISNKICSTVTFEPSTSVESMVDFAYFVNQEEDQKDKEDGKPILGFCRDNIRITPHTHTVSFLGNCIVITGPHASGKTTFMKSLMWNYILTHQYGIGMYSSLTLQKPISYFHCYLNINDTNQKDSLFQAEVRRCSDILQQIEKQPNKRHLCIMDELLTGTNPTHAVQTSYGFIKYICDTYPETCQLLVSTHYLDLCDKLQEVESLICKVFYGKMHEHEYSEGISDVTNVAEILQDMNMPEIIYKPK